MQTKESADPLDDSKEEKIIAAAKKIFTQKGYAATKIRDIAAEADINLALVNYYFRSKEKLFDVIMAENVKSLFDKIGPVLSDENSTLNEKIQFISGHYIDMLLENPDFARFVVNEVMSGSNKIPIVASKRDLIMNSHFSKQVLLLQVEGKIKFHPIHILMNIMSMILFPFLGQNLFSKVGIQKEVFRKLMEERKQLIPLWIESIIKS